MVTLTCEYSLPGVQFHWRKGFESLRPGDKYLMKQRKTIISLVIKALKPEDSGEYTCHCRDHRTTANLRVHGTSVTFSRFHGIKPHLTMPKTNICHFTNLNSQTFEVHGFDQTCRSVCLKVYFILIHINSVNGIHCCLRCPSYLNEQQEV